MFLRRSIEQFFSLEFWKLSILYSDSDRLHIIHEAKWALSLPALNRCQIRGSIMRCLKLRWYWNVHKTLSLWNITEEIIIDEFLLSLLLWVYRGILVKPSSHLVIKPWLDWRHPAATVYHAWRGYVLGHCVYLFLRQRFLNNFHFSFWRLLLNKLFFNRLLLSR